MSNVSYAIGRVDAGQKLMLSTDQGVTWFESSFSPDGTWRDIAVVPGYATRALVCSDSGNYYTLDGGLTWTLSGGTYIANDANVHLFVVDSAVSYSANTKIAKSTDGGLTFDEVSNIAFALGATKVTAIYFHTQTLGWVGMDTGKVYETTDGGVSWTVLNANASIDGSHQIDSIIYGNGLIVSTIGGIWRSLDAGTTFSSVHTYGVSTLGLTCLHKVSTLIYYSYAHVDDPAVGIYKTLYGGDTWTLVGTNSVWNFGAEYTYNEYGRDMHFYNSTTGIWINRIGSIYRSTDSATSATEVLAASGSFQAIKLTGGTYDCDTCPEGYTYNNATGLCENTVVSGPVCPDDYLWNPATEMCDSTIMPPLPSIDPMPCALDPNCSVIDVAGEFMCSCTDTIVVYPCCYALYNCVDPEAAPIYTQTDISEYEGLILSLAEYPGDCFYWEVVDGLCENPVSITIVETFATCRSCNPSYKLYNCQDLDSYIYTESDLSAYVEPSKVVTISEYPNTCWQVGINGDFPYTPETVTVTGEPFETCEACATKYYQLTNCNNSNITFLTTDDLAAYVDKTVSLTNYPGLCFQVTELLCNCITVDIEIPAGDFSGNLTSTTEINGKPAYYFTANAQDYLIGWSTTDSRWELYNITTDTVVSYISLSSDCPFSGRWVGTGTPVTVVNYVIPCITSIYNVSISKVFTDCECCLKKNCK